VPNTSFPVSRSMGALEANGKLLEMSDSDPIREKPWWQDAYNRGLMVTASSIMATFLLYGIIQEKIMTTPYGTNQALRGKRKLTNKVLRVKCLETRHFWC